MQTSIYGHGSTWRPRRKYPSRRDDRFVLLLPYQTIIDDGDSRWDDKGEAWSQSTALPDQRWGSTYSFGGGSSANCSWNPYLLWDGIYSVYARWTESGNRCPQVRYVVTDVSGTTDYDFDQTIDGGQWNLLGNHQFSAGNAVDAVAIDGASSFPSGFIIADAILMKLTGISFFKPFWAAGSTSIAAT